MSANLVRYLPGGKTVIVGVKPLNATPVIPYYRGNPKYKPCFTSFQSKNAKELIPIPCCERVQVKPPIDIPEEVCIIYDGGGAFSNFNTLLTSNGLSSIILNSSNPVCPYPEDIISCIIYDGGDARSKFNTLLTSNGISSIILNSSNPVCPYPEPTISCIIYDGGNAGSNFTRILNHNGTGVLLDSKNAYTNFC